MEILIFCGLSVCIFNQVFFMYCVVKYPKWVEKREKVAYHAGFEAGIEKGKNDLVAKAATYNRKIEEQFEGIDE